MVLFFSSLLGIQGDVRVTVKTCAYHSGLFWRDAFLFLCMVDSVVGCDAGGFRPKLVGGERGPHVGVRTSFLIPSICEGVRAGWAPVTRGSYLHAGVWPGIQGLAKFLDGRNQEVRLSLDALVLKISKLSDLYGAS